MRRWPARDGGVGLARPQRRRRAQEPGVERAIERLELLAAGDERLAKRPVHVLLAGEVDRVEAAQRVGDAPRADLEAAFAQHAAEDDDVANDRVLATALRAAQPRAVTTRPASASSRIESRSSWYLSSDPSVACTFSTSSSCWPRAVSARTQSIVSASPGGFCRSSDAQLGREPRRFLGQPVGHAGHAQLDDLDLARHRRMVDPVVEAAPLQRIVQLAGAVRGEDHVGPLLRLDRPQLGHRHLEVGEHLEQKRLELLVRAVDLVDQEQHALLGLDRLEHGPPDQELAAEQLGLVDRARLRCADVQQLAGVVPFVDRVGDIEPLVALQADQRRSRARLAIALAASVLPTPASPSSSSGFSRVSAR